MSERDGAWFARILARFTPEHVEAAVRVGDFTEERHTRFLVDQLVARRKAILDRYFARVSPLTDVRMAGHAELCATDLANLHTASPPASLRYTARVYAGDELEARGSHDARAGANGDLCVSLSHVADDGGDPDDAPSRYVIVDLQKAGRSKGPRRAHLYDLGPLRGFRLVGVERPEGSDPPG
jgi:hypothetical protein